MGRVFLYVAVLLDMTVAGPDFGLPVDLPQLPLSDERLPHVISPGTGVLGVSSGGAEIPLGGYGFGPVPSVP